jgi:cell division protein ZapE
MLTPYQVYQNALETGNYENDPAQALSMQALDRLYHEIQRNEKALWPLKILRKPQAKQGVYLYGEVGAGKTWMMDMFFSCLTVKKLRFHFHQFMREIHEDLQALQGHKNPLVLIAKNLKAKASVICFDELFVNDIGDAMLLGELFKNLFTQGIYFVMTSNVTPDLLYRNGLQRSRFLPAIHLLSEKMQMVQVKSLKDYRWRQALSEGVYFSPLNEETAGRIDHLFHTLILQEPVSHQPITINARELACIAHASDVLWCNFDQLCQVPRSVQDYVGLSQQFKVFILDNVKLITPENDNAIWYLISLVDVLYDAKCRVVLRAEVPPQDLYQGEKLRFEFQRTLSRLHEMQTKDYWG